MNSHLLSNMKAPALHALPRILKALTAGLAMALLLWGCAGQLAYRDGRSLVEAGQVEAGLAKFQEAIKASPLDAEYKAAYVQTRERAIQTYLEQADRTASTGQYGEAEQLYKRALAVDPTNERARAGLAGLAANQRHAQLLKEAAAHWEKRDSETAEQKLRGILIENPNHPGASSLMRSILDKTAKPTVDPSLSAAYKKPITVEFKDVTLKQVFEVISRTSGLNFLFDKDVKVDQKTSIFLRNSTVEAAVRFTLLTNQLEQQVLDGNTILVYPNTTAKQKDYQETVIKTFYLTNAEAKTVANTLKVLLKTTDIVVDDKLNMLILRQSPDAIRVAEKLVALHDVAEPEVMLEVEILEVKRTHLMELGIKWPNSLTLTPLPSSAGGTLTLRDLQSRLNSKTVGAGIGPVTINARKEDSDANLLANPRIRARNHEKAKILIGERVPNITTTATATGFVSESVNYVDVGLTLNVEPTIYLNNDVAIKVSLEVSNIINQVKTQSGSIAYQIGTRTASTVLRLKDGENQVLAGLINDEDRRTANKIPGFGDIPLLGRLFGSTRDDNQKTEIVLSITPHLIRNIQRPDASIAEFRTGSDNRYHVRSETSELPPTPRPPKADGPGTAPTAAPEPAPPNGPSPSNPPATKPPDTVGQSDGKVTSNTVAAPIPALGAGTTQLVWQGPSQLKVGEVFELQLAMQSNEPVTSLPMVVSFDSSVLQVVNVAEGGFLKQGGGKTNFTSRVAPAGQILMTGTRMGDGGATAHGTVASITFKALAASEAARVQLLQVTPVGLAGRSISAPAPPPQTMRVLP